MLIHGKQCANLKESDLRLLIEDKVSEGKNIEYKSELPKNSDGDKKEFLADLSSFANAAGGYIFFGISEDKGLPIEIEGLGDIDPDAQILRFENLLRDSVKPRLPGVIIRAIPVIEKGPVLVAYIPKSWASPHMVTYGRNSKFYSRNSAGKYPLDVFELRTAFNATNVDGEHLRAFRLDRIGRILSNETPVLIQNSAKVVLHLIPVSSFVSGIRYDLREFQVAPNKAYLTPVYAQSSSNLRFNFDGLLTYEKYNHGETAGSYLQLFRNGIIEAVDTFLLEDPEDPPAIPAQLLEDELITSLKKFIYIQNILETELPYFILLTLLGVQGHCLQKGNITYIKHRIDRSNLLVPEILVEDLSLPAATILKPAFDTIWNAGGQPHSPFYDLEGKRRPK